MEEFRCECAQTVPTFAVLSTATEWAVFRAMFHLAENEELFVLLGRTRAGPRWKPQEIGMIRSGDRSQGSPPRKTMALFRDDWWWKLKIEWVDGSTSHKKQPTTATNP